MICKTVSEHISDFQQVLGDNGRATLACQWAFDNFKGKSFDENMSDGLDFIKSIIRNTPSTKRGAKNLLSLMEGKKLLFKEKTYGAEHYTTKYPTVVEFLLKNKKKTIFAEMANISDLSEANKVLTIYAREKLLASDEVAMASFDNSTNKDINRIGEGMLGSSLMSLDGIVKTERVNQTIDTIVEKIAREVIAGNDLTKADVDSIIDGYYNLFADYADIAEEAGNEKVVEHLDSYLDKDNWSNLKNMVYTALKNRSGIVFKNGVKSKDLNASTISDEDAIKENNEDIDLDGGDKAQGNFADNFAITLDSKVGLSGKLKLFMSTLKTDKTHYLTGETLFENFDTAYNTLNAILAGEEPNIYGMIAKLKEYKDYAWVNDLIGKLEEANHKDSGNQDLIKQFVTAMNKHYINMSFVQWENTPNGHEMRIMNDNANSRQRTVTNDWVAKLNKTNLVYTDTEYKTLFDKEAAKNALVELNKFSAIDIDDLKASDISNVLKLVGINISVPTAKAIIDGKFEIRGEKISLAQFRNVNHKNSPLKYIGEILKNISTSSKTFEVGEKDVDFFRQGAVKSLANLEAKYTRHLYSNSHKSGGKTVFSYTNDKFIVDRMYELVRGYRTGNKDNFKLLEELSTDIFAGNSYWLSELKKAMDGGDTNFSENFEFGYLSLDPLKEKNGEATDRSLSDLSPKEIIAVKLAHFLNKGEVSKARRVIKMFYPTMSDKTTMLTIQSLMPEIGGGGIMYKLDGNKKSINDETVDFIYDTIVKSEMNRMREVQKLNASTDIDGYDKGANYFYTIPALNGIKDLFDFDKVPGKRILKSEDELSPETKQLVQSTIKRSLNAMIATQIEEFKENGIGYVEGEKNLQFMDLAGVSEIAGNYVNPSLKDKSDAVAAQFAISYFINNANISQLFHGDYAQYFKKNDVIDAYEEMIKQGNVTNLGLLHGMVKPTFDNLGKRLAADLAPGYEADWGDKTELKVTVSDDRKMVSLASEFIQKVYSDGTASSKSAIDAYNDINTSDAQSWSSLEFHIKTLFNFGNKNITEKEYNHLIDKINKAKTEGKDVHFEADELALILQPTKPLYSNNKQQNINQPNEDSKTIGVRKYIKTSSFPLIPQLVKGSELEHVMRAMEKGGVDLHVFESGFKVGMNAMHTDIEKGRKVPKRLELFNKDGSMNVENVNKLSLSENIMSLDIKGFKIQQEIPYHDHPFEINDGTQQRKMLFSNIKDIDGFHYHAEKNPDGTLKNLKGSDLEKIYNEKYKQLYSEAAKNLRKELYNDGQLNVEKIQQLFLEEANSRNYSINDKLGLALNEKKDGFEFPLWGLPAAHQYESMLISIVDNRVRKLKIPGNSFVLGSEAGFSFKKQVLSGEEGQAVVQKYQDQIIFTSNFDGESLQSYRENGTGMKPSQVFIPCKLKGADGHFIDLMKYTKKVDGRLMLDEERLPKDLLKLFGFRIPTQGHNSMAAIEIAGFLPKECGDLIIASQDLVVQMGSDKR